MKVIFLDIDGVLNGQRYVQAHPTDGAAIDPRRMELLKKLVDATGAQIVLSSSWREHWSPSGGDPISQIFARYGLKIISKTPEDGRCREDQIRAWLDSHEHQGFVVLDDGFLDEMGFLRGHFVRTSNWRGGLDEGGVAAAIEILCS